MCRVWDGEDGTATLTRGVPVKLQSMVARSLAFKIPGTSYAISSVFFLEASFLNEVTTSHIFVLHFSSQPETEY